jgi:hypothetical protein
MGLLQILRLKLHIFPRHRQTFVAELALQVEYGILGTSRHSREGLGVFVRKGVTQGVK